MAVRARGEGFQADFMVAGIRYREQFDTNLEAAQWEADTKAALLSGRPLPPSPNAKGAPMTIAQLQKHTFKKRWAGKKNERMAEINSLSAVSFYGPNTQVVAVAKPTKVAAYQDFLKADRGNAPSTINRKLSALKQMFKDAALMEVIASIPTFEREKGDGKTRTRYFKEAEAANMEAVFRHWGLEIDADYYVFLLETGCRLGEASRIRPKDIDFLAPLGLLIGAVGSIEGSEGSKNGETRRVGITARCREVLMRRLVGIPEDAPIFGKEVINENTFRSHYYKVRDHLNLGDDVVIHTTRHTTASWMVQRGVPLIQVKDWMGHKSLKVTLGYAHLAPQAMMDAMKLFEQRPEEPRPALAN